MPARRTERTIGAAGDAVGDPDGAQKLLDSVAPWAEICRRAMSSASRALRLDYNLLV